MLICIDIGNSSLGVGLFLSPEHKALRCIKKIPTYPYRTVEGYREMLNNLIKDCSKKGNLEYQDAIISSVVPDLNPLIVASLRGIIKKKPLFINYKTSGGLTFLIKKKRSIGADRIANAVGAYFHFNEPVAVIDCGSATTITVVGKNADIMGGAILPGIGLMQRSLHTGTAKLPNVHINRPKQYLGRDTISSIKSGIVYGTAGAIEKIISGIEQELGYTMRLVLTGGYLKFIAPIFRLKHVCIPNLIFEGMRLIYIKKSKTYN